MTARRICFDRILPRDQRRFQRTRTDQAGRVRAIAPRHSVWVNGSRIRIRFEEGDSDVVNVVQRVAVRWTDHANLQFEFTDDPRAEIRITFDEDDGAWSYIGTDNLDIPLHAATLNLGWVDEGVILHEFGHMVGLGHEHQSPHGGIEWDEAAVIADLSGRPNYWDVDTIRHNVLRKYSVDQIHGTEFDPDSIMLYEFPPEWTRNRPEGTHENDDLSAMDRAFVRSGQMYPGRPDPDARSVFLAMGSSAESAIEAREEEALYAFEVKKAGRHFVGTEGGLGLVLALFGPGQPTRLVARDDDGGSGLNARVVAYLEPGKYYAQVRRYDPESSGEYRVGVREL